MSRGRDTSWGSLGRSDMGRRGLVPLLVATLIPIGRPHAAPGGAPVKPSGELVMFETAICPVCLRWHRELDAIYPKTPEAVVAPLRRVTLGTDSGILLAEPVRYAPTFVFARDGREFGRITGYLNDDMFWGQLDALLARQPGGWSPL